MTSCARPWASLRLLLRYHRAPANLDHGHGHHRCCRGCFVRARRTAQYGGKMSGLVSDTPTTVATFW
jgi:hypothetical protein